MAFPLATVLAAAPGIISAAADIIKVIRNRKTDHSLQQPGVERERFEELVTLIEKQAVVIEDLARNNNELALAVRNNRIIAVVSVITALLAIGIALVV